MNKGIYLLLGSNQGNREVYITKSLSLLETPELRLVRSSSLFESEPWGNTEQPSFLNQVIEIKCSKNPLQLLNHILEVEQLLGRQRNGKWGPRTIDIDILFYRDEILDHPDLTIPHPEIAGRRFTLEPLCELIPDFVHPVLGKTIRELLEMCSDSGQVSILR